MTLDALDPGPDWSFPNVPRDADGYLDETRMPIGLRGRMTPGGVVYDVTPTVRLLDGGPVPLTDAVPRRPGA